MTGIRDGFRLDQQRRGLSARTIIERDRVLDSLARWADGVPVAALEREDIETWLDSLTLSPRARSCYLSTVHVLFDWMLYEGHVTVDPTVRIRRPILPRIKPRPIADDDLDIAIRSARPRMKAWLTLAAYQGFRAKEIATLRREDIIEKRRLPLLRVSEGKGGHQALLPLNSEVAHALHAYGLPSRGLVFAKANGDPIPPSTVSRLGAAYLRRLGIDATLHQLRHWFGTAVWAASKDLRVTQEMLRHANPATTAGYVAFDHDLAKAVVVDLRVGQRANGYEPPRREPLPVPRSPTDSA